MVMMEKPSPMQVGREFVRQYYTLLNKAPALLHRFYSYNSSYVHGGKYSDGEPEKPVIGQNEIHKKIDSLNFCDCHTKIRQVDAHSTIGSGVVVQVTGELSNSGQPLRRFMQTFVLAPQGDNPYKFYVHNDIFRYQDEVFNDEMHTAHSEGENDIDERINEQPAVDENQVDDYEEDFYQPPDSHNAANEQQNIMTNGIDKPIETAMDQHNDTPSPVPEDPVDRVSPVPTPPPETNDFVDASPEKEETPEESVQEPEVEKEKLEPEEKAPSKPFSWAHLASKNTPATRSAPPQPAATKPSRPPVEQSENSDSNKDRPPRPQRNNQRPPVRDEERGGSERTDANRRFGAGNGAGNPIRYPDNQQIFVGNLPYVISEDDLREHFADFGHVLEVRINQSQSNSPNFGFVIFEDPKSVEDVLIVMYGVFLYKEMWLHKSMSMFLQPTHHKNGHRINIEEKKQRNNRDMARRPGGDMRRGGGMGEGGRGGRRPPNPVRRDRQGSRDGPRPNYTNGPRR